MIQKIRHLINQVGGESYFVNKLRENILNLQKEIQKKKENRKNLITAPKINIDNHKYNDKRGIFFYSDDMIEDEKSNLSLVSLKLENRNLQKLLQYIILPSNDQGYNGEQFYIEEIDNPFNTQIFDILFSDFESFI